MMNKRVIALDIGDTRIGVAVSDESRIIASPHDVFIRKGIKADVERVVLLCRHFDTSDIVAGLPVNMNGSLGIQAEHTIYFCDKLKEAGLNVIYQDERSTTKTAVQVLICGNVRRSARKEKVDMIAAAVILQSWLDKETNQIRNREDVTMETDDQNELVELIDEEGKSVYFEHLMTIEHEGENYLLLTPPIDELDQNTDEGEVVILKIAKDDEGNDCYVSIEDEDVIQAVYDKFIEMIDEEDDLPSDEDEDDSI